MSLRKGTYLGIGALVAGGGGFWFQEELINRHRYSCEKRVDFKSESLFREYLACTYAGPSVGDNIMCNYSGTHTVDPRYFYEPNTIKDVQKIVSGAQRLNKKIRPVGRFLSPNGIASCKEGMLSLNFCDRIVHVDQTKKQITVEAGIVVDDILKELQKYGLTLANFSSIKEQQVGGWTQVGAHGTGARLPTVDEMVISLKVVTPNLGTFKLHKDMPSRVDREFFKLFRCGLGSLGIVTELTLQCIDSHWLNEATEVLQVDEISDQHEKLLRNFRHVRYMWIPYTESIVIVKSNPTKKEGDVLISEERQEILVNPLRSLLLKNNHSREEIDGLSFSQLRDRLLDINPLDTTHVKEVNQAESEFWHLNRGYRSAPSDEILGFDCGGQQWVLEVAFPTGTLDETTGTDINFVVELKRRLENAGIPAPGPIEQRWSSASSSYLSPAYSENPDSIFSWVGIIMYLPPGQNSENRAKIAENFQKYANILYDVGGKYGAVPHWAKIEIPEEDENRTTWNEVKKLLHYKYNIAKFCEGMTLFDPKGVLLNDLMEELVS